LVGSNMVRERECGGSSLCRGARRGCCGARRGAAGARRGCRGVRTVPRGCNVKASPPPRLGSARSPLPAASNTRVARCK
jgi:hypothetical protein